MAQFSIKENLSNNGIVDASVAVVSALVYRAASSLRSDGFCNIIHGKLCKECFVPADLIMTDGWLRISPPPLKSCVKNLPDWSQGALYKLWPRESEILGEVPMQQRELRLKTNKNELKLFILLRLFKKKPKNLKFSIRARLNFSEKMLIVYS